MNRTAFLLSTLLFSTSTPLNETLIEKLLPREHHAARYEVDESPLQLLDIRDQRALQTIDRYVAHFDALEQEDFQQYFPKQYSDEHGGVVIANMFGLDFVEFPNESTQQTCGQRLQFFSTAAQNRNVGVLGYFHTHPRSACAPYVMPSPSGSRTESLNELVQRSKGAAVVGDCEGLRAGAKTKPLQMDVLIAEVDTLAYNVDVYFVLPSDLSSRVTVIDIGTYRF